eukprot:11097994-Alexandrium_andersonii.AAC.1
MTAVSSAKARTMPSFPSASLRFLRRRSATTAKSSGDRGQPCRIPTSATNDSTCRRPMNCLLSK